MKSSQNTLWVAGAGVLAVLLVIATYLLVIDPRRSEAADLADQRVSVQQSNAQLAQQTALLKSQFATLDEKRTELKAIEATLPSQADVPDLLRQIETYATSAGLTLTQVAPGAPAPYAASTGATANTTASTTDGSGIVAIPLTVTVNGTFPEIELYVKNLQVDVVRHFLVDGVTLTTDPSAASSDAVTGTITGSVFVLTSTGGTSSSTSTTSSSAVTPPTTPTTPAGTSDTAAVS